MELVLMAAATSNSSNLFNIIGNMSCALSFLFDNDNWPDLFSENPNRHRIWAFGTVEPNFVEARPKYLNW